MRTCARLRAHARAKSRGTCHELPAEMVIGLHRLWPLAEKAECCRSSARRPGDLRGVVELELRASSRKAFRRPSARCRSRSRSQTARLANFSAAFVNARDRGSASRRQLDMLTTEGRKWQVYPGALHIEILIVRLDYERKTQF